MNAKTRAITLFLASALSVVGLGITAEYAVHAQTPTPRVARTADAGDDDPNPFIAEAPPKTPTADNGNSSWVASSITTLSRLLLAVILSGVLAFRPRRDVPLFRRSLFVSQTQILLSVVAAALMMIVGDNTARAFAIFAAVSLVRFRTNIRDPKEITVLLISLALGLAAGVGRWDLGVSLCLFALALLWLLEHRETEQVVRSMELTIKTRNAEKTQEILKKIFKRMKIDAEVRQFEPADAENIGSIVYYLNLQLKLTTDFVSDRIMAADPQNVEGIQWSRSKGSADIYQ